MSEDLKSRESALINEIDELELTLIDSKKKLKEVRNAIKRRAKEEIRQKEIDERKAIFFEDPRDLSVEEKSVIEAYIVELSDQREFRIRLLKGLVQFKTYLGLHIANPNGITNVADRINTYLSKFPNFKLRLVSSKTKDNAKRYVSLHSPPYQGGRCKVGYHAWIPIESLKVILNNDPKQLKKYKIN